MNERAEEAGWERVAGTYHWGCWHEKIKTGRDKHVVKTLDTVAGGSHVTRLRDQLMDGALAILTKAASFCLGIADPQQLAKNIEVVKNTPTATYTIPEEPFTLRADVTNLLTESHIDANDCIKGLACIIPVGKFEGKHTGTAKK